MNPLLRMRLTVLDNAYPSLDRWSRSIATMLPPSGDLSWKPFRVSTTNQPWRSASARTARHCPLSILPQPLLYRQGITIP
jgi:hypothetical protein